jgi:hypothetical protein
MDGFVSKRSLVQVVEHQPHPLIQRAQILHQASDDGRAVQTGGGGQLPHPPRPDRRPPQRLQNRQPERLPVALPTPHRHRRRPVAQTHRGDPRAQQKRLPAPRRHRHVHHTLPRAQPPDQARRGTNHALTPGPAGSTAAAKSATTRTWSHPGMLNPWISPNHAMRTNPSDPDSDRMAAQDRPTDDRGARRYEILVREPIGPTTMQAFPTLAASRSARDTLLTGSLPDQSALYGVIHQLEALGLQLLEIGRLSTGDPERAAQCPTRCH